MDKLLLEIKQVERFLDVFWKFSKATFLDDRNLFFAVLNDEEFTCNILVVNCF